jgi:hypothetical protein
MDLINNKNSQLLWSINYNKSESDKFIKTELFNQNKRFLGILLMSKTLKIFNNERVITEIEAKYLNF